MGASPSAASSSSCEVRDTEWQWVNKEGHSSRPVETKVEETMTTLASSPAVAKDVEKEDKKKEEEEEEHKKKGEEEEEEEEENKERVTLESGSGTTIVTSTHRPSPTAQGSWRVPLRW